MTWTEIKNYYFGAQITLKIIKYNLAICSSIYLKINIPRVAYFLLCIFTKNRDNVEKIKNLKVSLPQRQQPSKFKTIKLYEDDNENKKKLNLKINWLL